LVFVAIGVGAFAIATLAAICEALSMIFEIILSAVIATSLLVYLVIATTPTERS
jgi:hypothetical protein